MYRKILSLFIFFIIILNFVGVVQASEPYSLTALDIEYDYGQKIIYARGEVVFKAEDIEIKADSLSVYISRDWAVAEGKEVILNSPEEKIRGTHLEYNYKQGTGTFYGAESKFDNLNFRGKSIKITDAQDYKYRIEEAAFSPCILPEPHYQLQAGEVKIYPGEEIIGEDITLWWGKTRLIELPYYVLSYDEEGEAENTFPVPELGYNSEEGLIMTLTYPYQINTKSRGNVFLSLNQIGNRKAEIDNIYNLKKNLTLQTNYNYDKVIEDDESEEVQEILASELCYNFAENYQLYSELRYEKEIDNQNTELSKLIGGGLKYSGRKVYLDTFAGYNFIRKQRQEELLLTYKVNDYGKAEISGLFYDENPARYAYKFRGSQPLPWEIIYREGYDLDYSPYINLKLPAYCGLGINFAAGQVTEDMLTADKVKTKFNVSKDYTPWEGFTLDFAGGYTCHYYLNPGEKYEVLSAKVKAGYNYKVSEKNNLRAGFSWQKTFTEGDFLLPADEIEEKEIMESELQLEIPTSQPLSAWEIENYNSYRLSSGEWEEIKLGIKRKYDCYSWQVNYDFINHSYTFSVNL